MFEFVVLIGIVGSLMVVLWYLLIRKGRQRMIKTVILMLIIIISLGGSVYKISQSRTYQFFGHLVYAGDTDEKIVALTFDDGPYPDTTDEVLSILAEQEVEATFFLNGERIDTNAAETTAIINAGHELGNHSYTHPRMVFMSYRDIKDEMEKTDEAMRKLSYEPTGYVRSPYCKKLFLFPWYLRQTHQINVIWTLEPETYYKEVEDMLNYTIENIEPGGIILLHALPTSRETTRALLEPLIVSLKKEGYSFVTISELLD